MSTRIVDLYETSRKLQRRLQIRRPTFPYTPCMSVLLVMPLRPSNTEKVAVFVPLKVSSPYGPSVAIKDI